MADRESLFIHWDNADKSLWERIAKYESAQNVESLIITSAAEFYSVFMRKLDGSSETDGDSGSRGYKFISNHDRREFERIYSEMQKDPHNRRVIALRTKGNIPLAMAYLVARTVPEYVAHLSYERTRARKKDGKDDERLMKFVEITEERDLAKGKYELPLHNKSSDQSKEWKRRVRGHTFFGNNSAPTALLPFSEETAELNKMGSLKSVKGIVSVDSIQYSYTYAAMICIYKGLLISPNTVFISPVVPDKDESNRFFFPSYASFLNTSLNFVGPFALAYKYKDTKVSFLRTTIRRKVKKDANDDTQAVDSGKKDEKKRPTQRFLIRFFGLASGEIDEFFKSIKYDENKPMNIKHERRDALDEAGNPIVEELDDSEEADELDEALGFGDRATNATKEEVDNFQNPEMFPPESPEIKQENVNSEAIKSQLIEHEDEEDEASYEESADPELEVVPKQQIERNKIVQVGNDDLERLESAAVNIAGTPVSGIVPDKRSIFGAAAHVTPSAPATTNVDDLIHAIDKNAALPPVPKSSGTPSDTPANTQNIVTSVDAINPTVFSVNRVRRPPTIATVNGAKPKTPRPPTTPGNPYTPSNPITPASNQVAQPNQVPQVPMPLTPNQQNQVVHPNQQNQVVHPNQQNQVVHPNQQNQVAHQYQQNQVAHQYQQNQVVHPNQQNQVAHQYQQNQVVQPNQTPIQSNQQPHFPYHYFYGQPGVALPKPPRTGYRMYKSPTKRRSRATSPVYPLTVSPAYPYAYNTMVTPTSTVPGSPMPVGTPVSTGGVVMNTPQVVINTPQILLNASSRNNVMDAWNQFQTFSNNDPTLAPEAQHLKSILTELGIISRS